MLSRTRRPQHSKGAAVVIVLLLLLGSGEALADRCCTGANGEGEAISDRAYGIWRGAAVDR